MFHRLAFAAALLLSTSAWADKVAGWEVAPKPDGDGSCSIQYDYVDKEDNNAENSVNFTFLKGKDGGLVLLVVLGYSKWEWEKNEKATADLILGDTVEQRATNWAASTKNVLFTTFSGADSLVQTIGRVDQIALRFDGDKDNEAWFKIPDAGQAIGASQACRGQLK